MRAKYLASYVNVNLLNQLGFNEYEPSFNFTRGAGEKMKSCRAHIGYYPEKESVLVIIRAQDENKKRKRREWFFDTVSSKGVYNLEGLQDGEKIMEICVNTVSRKNRIAGKDLETELEGIAF